MNLEDEKPKPCIEEAIAELEGILSSLENDATSLEESLSREAALAWPPLGQLSVSQADS